MLDQTFFLNGLRVLAAYWVMIEHCMIWGGSAVHLPRASMAVDLFMVLSGFLMAYTVLLRETGEPIDRPRSWVKFWGRRFFRIAPAFYLALALAVLLAGPFLGGYDDLRALNPELWPVGGTYSPVIEYSVTNILLHLTFVFGILPSYSMSTTLPDWSISLEMQFYFVFPFVLLAMRRYGTFKVAVLLVVVSYAVTWLFTRASHAGLISLYPQPSALHLRLPIFLSGVLIYFASRADISKWMRVGYLALALGNCMLMWRSYGWHVAWLVGAVAFMAFIAVPAKATIAARVRVNRWCSGRAVSILADTSYSVFLFHGFFIAIVGSRIAAAAQAAGYSLTQGAFLMVAAVVPLSLGFATLAYRFVELPCIRLGQRILSRPVPGANVRLA